MLMGGVTAERGEKIRNGRRGEKIMNGKAAVALGSRCARDGARRVRSCGVREAARDGARYAPHASAAVLALSQGRSMSRRGAFARRLTHGLELSEARRRISLCRRDLLVLGRELREERLKSLSSRRRRRLELPLDALPGRRLPWRQVVGPARIDA